MNHSFLFLATLFFSVSISLSARADIDNHRVWFGVFQKSKFSESLEFQNEAQLRLNSEAGTTQQLLVRPALLQKISETQELGYLFAVVQTGTTIEYRPTFQYSHQLGQIGESSLSFRGRLEYRHLEAQSDDAGRARAQVTWKIPYSSDKNWLVWDEIFLHIHNQPWTGNKAFDRNRVFVGMRFQLGFKQVDVGYLNQYIESATMSGAEHILLFYMFL